VSKETPAAAMELPQTPPPLSGGVAAASAVRHWVTPEEIAETLRRAGYRASVAEREQGPQVHSAAHGMSFVVGFGRPTADGRKFVDLSFYCPLAVHGEIAAAVIAGWNRSKRFARLFRQDQAVVLSMDLLLAGGVTDANLLAQCELWDHLLRDLLLYLSQPAQREAQAA